MNGIIPALVTPLHEDYSLDITAVEAHLHRVYNTGCHGVYLCGSTGEGLLLPPATRKRIVEIAGRITPTGRFLIVHVGAHTVADAKELARHAEQHGAAAISALRPAGSSFPELLEYYRQLASETRLPFLGYYFPSDYGGTLQIGQLEQICALPGVAGLKFTDYDLYTLSLLARQGKLIFHGRDEMLSAGFLMGAVGGIGSIYNVVPDWFVALYNHTQAGRWSDAREIQDRINDLIRVLVSFPFMPALKRTLEYQGLRCGPALPPRLPLTEAQDRALLAALEPLELPRAVAGSFR